MSRQHLKGQTESELLALVADTRKAPSARAQAARQLASGEWEPPGLHTFVRIPVDRMAGDQPDFRFMIARYPVTNRQFSRFISDHGYSSNSYWSDDESAMRRPPAPPIIPTDASRSYDPVVGITYREAKAYTRWLQEKWDGLEEGQANGPLPAGWSVTIPNTAEWITAAGGAEHGRYPWGARWQSSLANTAQAKINEPTPVGVYPHGASPHGLLDMAGNVFEYTEQVSKDSGRSYLMGGSFRAPYWDARVRGSGMFAAGDSRADDRGFRVCVRSSLGPVSRETHHTLRLPAGGAWLVPQVLTPAGPLESPYLKRLLVLREHTLDTNIPEPSYLAAHLAASFALAVSESVLNDLPPAAYGLWAQIGPTADAMAAARHVKDWGRRAVAYGAIATTVGRKHGLPRAKGAWKLASSAAMAPTEPWRRTDNFVALTHWAALHGDSRHAHAALIEALRHAHAVESGHGQISLGIRIAQDALTIGDRESASAAIRLVVNAMAQGQVEEVPKEARAALLPLCVQVGDEAVLTDALVLATETDGDDWLSAVRAVAEASTGEFDLALRSVKTIEALAPRATALLSLASLCMPAGQVAVASDCLCKARAAAMRDPELARRCEMLSQVASLFADLRQWRLARATWRTAARSLDELRRTRGGGWSDASARLADWMVAHGEYDLGIATARRSGWRASHADILSKAIARVYWSVGGGTRLVERLQHVGRMAAGSHLRLTVLRDIATSDFAQSLATAKAFDASTRLAAQIRDPELRSPVQAGLSLALAAAGHRDSSRDVMAKAVKAVSEIRSPGDAARVTVRLFAIAKQLWDEQLAEEQLAALVKQLRAVDNIRNWMQAMKPVGVQLVEAGYVEIAHELLGASEMARRRARDEGVLWVSLVLSAGMARVWAAIGAEDTAKELVSEVLDAQALIEAPRERAEVLTELADAQLALGLYDPAEDSLMMALDQLDRISGWGTAHIHNMVASISASAGLLNVAFRNLLILSQGNRGDWIVAVALRELARALSRQARESSRHRVDEAGDEEVPGTRNGEQQPLKDYWPLRTPNGTIVVKLPFDIYEPVTQLIRIAREAGPGHVRVAAGALAPLLIEHLGSEAVVGLVSNMDQIEAGLNDPSTFDFVR